MTGIFGIFGILVLVLIPIIAYYVLFVIRKKEIKMDTKKILSGALVWTVGLLVPLLYHALLIHAAVQENGHTYSYHAMVKYFFTLPWIIWPYLIAMTIVGTCLVLSGIKNK